MINVLKTIITNVLTALYQPFWFAIILSVCVMFIYKSYPNMKAAAVQWICWFKNDASFRKMFVFVFYIVMILFRTLLNRDIWANPLYDVLGNWGLFKSDGTLTTEVIENLALFVPFAVMLLWTYKDRLINKRITLVRTIWISVKITFLSSFTIEMLQLFLRLGTWQLSDLFYNTLGGFLGGLIYWCGYKIVHRKDN